MTSRLPLAAAAALLLAFALTACSSDAAPEEITTTPPAAEGTPTPVVEEPTAEPDEPAATPTCETIISAGTVATFADLGWTPEQSEFHIGEEALDGGIYCSWADWEQPSDHGQFFAWAPLTADQGAEAQNVLLSEGWIREDGDEGVYFTEDPSLAFQTDEDGYGMTYLFGDGWVKFADTKQSLILIEWS